MSEKLIPIDPNNIKHIKLIDEYQKNNPIATPIGTMKKEDDSNDISMELILEEKQQVKDICHIQGVKDIKQCTISFLAKDKKKRKIIPLATSYAIDILGMEEVFIKTNPDDKNMLQYLNENNYECLGDDKGKIIFLKEKDNNIEG